MCAGGTEWYEWVVPAVGLTHLAVNGAKAGLDKLAPDPPAIPEQKIPPPPDYADQAVRAAALAERNRSMGGSRRRSIMGAGSNGATSIPAIKAPTLSGT